MMSRFSVAFLAIVAAVEAGKIAHTVAVSEHHHGISQTTPNTEKPRTHAARYASRSRHGPEEIEIDDYVDDSDDGIHSTESEYERTRRNQLEAGLEDRTKSLDTIDDEARKHNDEGQPQRSLYLREWYVMDRKQWKRKVKSYWKEEASNSDEHGDGAVAHDRSSTGTDGSIPGDGTKDKDADADDSSSASNSGSEGETESETETESDTDGDDSDLLLLSSSPPTPSPSNSAAPTAFADNNCKVSLHTTTKAKVDLRTAMDRGWMEATYDRRENILTCSRCYELEFEDCSGVAIECPDKWSCRDSSFVTTPTEDSSSSSTPTSLRIHCKGTESCIRSTLSNFETITCSGVDSCADAVVVDSNELECLTEDSCRGLKFQ